MNQEEVWDAIGKHWKEFRREVSPTVEKFLSGKSGKILDVGCGSGRNLLCKEAGSGVQVTGELKWYGIDFSSEMVRFAKERGYFEVLKGDVSELPYEDSFFDYVLFYAVLHCIDSEEKRKKSLKEIYRVLKRGGKVLISSWGRKSPRLKNKGKECFIPWSSRDEGEKIERYTYVYDLEELRKLVEEVGFEVLECWEERNVNLILRKK
jgi:ubiquinone/menaquinone biosynthesis C-methylase UbiE